VPAPLWARGAQGSTSTSGYVNTTTGRLAQARSSGFTLRFAPDGSYEYVGIMVVQTRLARPRS
jgi:hypothetical protein